MPPRSAEPHELPGPDQRLGPYRLIRPVSAGGMARVYEGRLDSLAGVSTRVAVKVIHPEYAADSGFQDLFIAEARISSRLEHQNVVRVQQFNREGALYYLVMEFIDGVTFRRLISLSRRSRIQLTPAQVAELGRQACEGLHYAHGLTGEDGAALGLVHRDVKPSNLMVTTQGVVKVLDFGISAAQGGEVGASGDGPVVKGTWGYMAPEQAEGLPVGPASDVFGLGAVLFELATGEALFPHAEPALIKEKLAADEGARRAAALGGPWRELGSLLVRALQRDPSARYPTAAAFGRALAGLAGDRLLVHDELVALAREAGPGDSPTAAQPPVSIPERPRSVSTVAVGANGLPVAVGDERGPRPARVERPARKPRRTSVGASVAILALLLAALGALAAVSFLAPPARWFSPTTPAAPPGVAPRADGVGFAGDGEVEVVPAAGGVPVEAGSGEASGEGTAAAGGDAAGAAATAATPDAPPGTTPGTSSAASSPAPSDASGASAAASPAPPSASRPRSTTRAAPSPSPSTGSASPATTAAASASATGLLTVSSVPRAQVLLDGQYVDFTPYFQRKTGVGAHTVVLVAEDGRRKSFKVEVAADAETRRVWLFDEERWGE